MNTEITAEAKEGHARGVSDLKRWLYKKFWWITGWLFIRWWHKLMIKFSWYPWWRKLKRFIGDTKDALVKHRFRYFIVKTMRADSWCCPHCRYDGWTEHEELYDCTDGGEQYIPGMPTEHWWEGYQECYRCGKSEYYSDST